MGEKKRVIGRILLALWAWEVALGVKLGTKKRRVDWQDITCTLGRGSGIQDKNPPGNHTSLDQSAAKHPERFPS